ncbi:unnamed protein product, partial [Linum tenue]
MKSIFFLVLLITCLIQGNEVAANSNVKLCKFASMQLDTYGLTYHSLVNVCNVQCLKLYGHSVSGRIPKYGF